MLKFLGWAARLAAVVAAILAGVTLYAAAPEADDAGSEAARARLLCTMDRTDRMLRALDANPEAALRRQAEIMAGCPAAPRREWDDATRDRGLALGGGAFVLLIVGAMLASMAKRERLAEEMLAEARKRPHG